MKAIIKTKSIAAALIIISMGFTGPVISAAKSGTPVEFQFLGNLSDGPLFQLKVNESVPGKFLVTLKEADGNILYSEKVTGKNVVRKYKINVNPEDLLSFRMVVEITNIATRETLVYNVSNKNRIVNDIIVAKL